MQVPSLEQFEAQAELLRQALARIAKLEAAQPDWLREEDAQQLTGLSQSSLFRERKRPGTVLVVTDSGPLRYLRTSVEAFNESRLLRRTPQAA